MAVNYFVGGNLVHVCNLVEKDDRLNPTDLQGQQRSILY